MKIVVILLFGFCLFFFTTFKVRAMASNQMQNNQRFAPCPSSPNCVSTKAEKSDTHWIEVIRYELSDEFIKETLKKILLDLPRTRLVEDDGRYLHFEIKSFLFRFVDDIEFEIVPEEKLIHVRSASRVGYSDLGVNRERVELIRKKLGSNP